MNEPTSPAMPRVLVAVATPEEAQFLLPLAHMLAHDHVRGQIIVLLIKAVPEGEPLSAAAGPLSRLRESIGEMLRRYGVPATYVHSIARRPDQIWPSLCEQARREHVDTLLVSWPGEAILSLESLALDGLPCHLVVARPGHTADWNEVKRILLPVRGGPYDAEALRVALNLAEQTEARITLLHATGEAPYDADERLFTEFGAALRGLKAITRSVTTLEEMETAVRTESASYDVVVMGASSRNNPPGKLLSPRAERLVRDIPATLLIVKPVASQARQEAAERRAEARAARRPISLVVDRWFAENTFRSQEFADLERLVRIKEQQGLTISLGLPALNEEATIGKIITTVKKALMEDFPLLDEMVLIDSGSVDYTREIAAELGIPVYIHQEVLPQHGAFHGKGEALWKSLYVLNGDIIAWIDTDISNIHPRFVYGIIGPLLTNPKIQYVKGFYRRPLKQGDKVVAGGGGRVTELTARPMLNMFFPELSGLIQPLSGEYAGRREALERLPFFTGFGVETGLLIDLLSYFGLSAIAQVDLRERIHRNKPLPDLSPMSFAIIQVVVKRLEERHKIRLLEDINKTMNLIRYAPGRYYLDQREVIEHERPPMIEIPEYQEKRARQGAKKATSSRPEQNEKGT